MNSKIAPIFSIGDNLRQITEPRGSSTIAVIGNAGFSTGGNLRVLRGNRFSLSSPADVTSRRKGINRLEYRVLESGFRK